MDTCVRARIVTVGVVWREDGRWRLSGWHFTDGDGTLAAGDLVAGWYPEQLSVLAQVVIAFGHDAAVRLAEEYRRQ